LQQTPTRLRTARRVCRTRAREDLSQRVDGVRRVGGARRRRDDAVAGTADREQVLPCEPGPPRIGRDGPERFQDAKREVRLARVAACPREREVREELGLRQALRSRHERSTPRQIQRRGVFTERGARECTQGLRLDELRRELVLRRELHDIGRPIPRRRRIPGGEPSPRRDQLPRELGARLEAHDELRRELGETRKCRTVEVDHRAARAVGERDHGALARQRGPVHEVREPLGGWTPAITRFDQPELGAQCGGPRARHHVRRRFERAERCPDLGQIARDRISMCAPGGFDESLHRCSVGHPTPTSPRLLYTLEVSTAPTTLSTEASYRTLYTLAVGGMGQVDLAVRREGSFERLFAIKRLRPELVSEPDVRAMFLDEARIAGLIRHPNVVSVVDVGEDAKGPFAVMEFVEGISVAELLARRDLQPLPMAVALRIALQVADGLHAAHELAGPSGEPLELVHRDVSPQNVLIGFDGIARVTDFGIAKALGRVSKTSTGVLKGKLGYISPEQLRFEEPDRRADLFALGVVMFELLTGQRLYRSMEGTDGPRRILTEPPPDLADYRDDAEPELVALLFELLAKERAARPPTARHVARRLEGLLATLTTAGETVDTAEFITQSFGGEREALRARIASAQAEPNRGRRRPRRGPLLAAVLAVMVGAAGMYLFTRAEPAAVATPERPAIAAPPPRELAPLAEPVPAPDAAARQAPEEPSPLPRRAPAPAPRKPPKSGVPMWETY
jgi:serine/threonine-protein kinase